MTDLAPPTDSGPELEVIRADRRTLAGIRDPQALQDARQAIADLLDREIDVARRLLDLEERQIYLTEQAATIQDFAGRTGLAPERTAVLLFLARALRHDPRFEVELREGLLALEAVSSVGRVYHRLGGPDPDVDWHERARRCALPSLRRAVRKRLAEIDQHEPGLETLTFHVPPVAREAFDRARVIASRRTRRALTEDETFVHVVDDFLTRHDPARSGQGTGKRRTPCYEAWPPTRTVPPEVVKKLRDLYGDACCVPGCTNRIFLDLAHQVAYADGGGQEIANIGTTCTRHHLMRDAGTLMAVGFTEEGRLVFQTQDGRILHPDMRAGWLPPPSGRVEAGVDPPPGDLPLAGDGPSPEAGAGMVRDRLGHAWPGSGPPPMRSRRDLQDRLVSLVGRTSRRWRWVMPPRRGPARRGAGRVRRVAVGARVARVPSTRRPPVPRARGPRRMGRCSPGRSGLGHGGGPPHGGDRTG